MLKRTMLKDVIKKLPNLLISSNKKLVFYVILGGPGSEEATGGEHLKRKFNLYQGIFVFFYKAKRFVLR